MEKETRCGDRAPRRARASRAHRERLGVSPPRHADQPEDVHREEGQIEAGDEQPEYPCAETLVEQTSRYFGKPVIHRAEQREDGAADEHVVEVRYDEECVVD